MCDFLQSNSLGSLPCSFTVGCDRNGILSVKNPLKFSFLGTSTDLVLLQKAGQLSKSRVCACVIDDVTVTYEKLESV